MSLHATHQPAISLSFRFRNPFGRHDGAQHDRQQPDHYQAAYELGGDELPADQYRDDDPKFEDQIGRGELEGNRRDEIGPLAEDRSRQRHRSVRTRR